MNKITRKPKLPKQVGKWRLTDMCGDRHKTVIYEHEGDGGAVVLRPTGGGPPVMVFSPDGSMTRKQKDELDLLLKYSLRGTDGVDVPLDHLIVKGSVEDAYMEAGIQ